MNRHQQKAYKKAKKRVEKEKGFYSHLTIYILVNLFLLFINVDHGDKNFQNWLHWNLYITPILWGIGLAFHGLNVFYTSFIFGKKWEERKIKELMDNDNF